MRHRHRFYRWVAILAALLLLVVLIAACRRSRERQDVTRDRPLGRSRDT